MSNIVKFEMSNLKCQILSILKCRFRFFKPSSFEFGISNFQIWTSKFEILNLQNSTSTLTVPTSVQKGLIISQVFAQVIGQEETGVVFVRRSSQSVMTTVHQSPFKRHTVAVALFKQ